MNQWDCLTFPRCGSSIQHGRIEHWEQVCEEIMNEFIILLRPSPFMLNNLLLTIYSFYIQLILLILSKNFVIS